MDYPKFIVSNQKREFISIHKAGKETLLEKETTNSYLMCNLALLVGGTSLSLKDDNFQLKYYRINHSHKPHKRI